MKTSVAVLLVCVCMVYVVALPLPQNLVYTINPSMVRSGISSLPSHISSLTLYTVENLHSVPFGQIQSSSRQALFITGTGQQSAVYYRENSGPWQEQIGGNTGVGGFFNGDGGYPGGDRRQPDGGSDNYPPGYNPKEDAEPFNSLMAAHKHLIQGW